MAKTFGAVLEHLQGSGQNDEHSPHKYVPGRKSAYSIPDMIERGSVLLMQQDTQVDDVEIDDILDPQVDAEDIIIDL